jgi:putative tryptophan/tyrosine transport system substrate-binding protein
MRRRSFIKVIAGAAVAWPSITRSQQPTMPVIGWLGSTTRPLPPSAAAFDAGLKETGYVPGQTVAIEYRLAEGRYERLPALAADLVERKVTLIIAASNVDAARAAKEATSVIPIVFFVGADPLANKLVPSLNRPGGNITGITIFAAELSAKRTEMLRQLRPNSKTIGMLWNPKNQSHKPTINSDYLEKRFQAQGLAIEHAYASAEDEIEPALAGLGQKHVDALFVAADSLWGTHREHVAAAALRHGIATIFPDKESVVAGGLISYGPSFADGYRQVGNYAGRVLNGEKPADLPVQQPTKFELVINLRTAKALGVTIPDLLLVQASEVIE